jgi:hypothetical protein
VQFGAKERNRAVDRIGAGGLTPRRMAMHFARIDDKLGAAAALAREFNKLAS